MSNRKSRVYSLADVSCQAMHAGVIRDMEQQRLKKERQLDFEMQRELEAEYRKVQHVSDSQSNELDKAK